MESVRQKSVENDVFIIAAHLSNADWIFFSEESGKDHLSFHEV